MKKLVSTILYSSRNNVEKGHVLVLNPGLSVSISLYISISPSYIFLACHSFCGAGAGGTVIKLPSRAGAVIINYGSGYGSLLLNQKLEEISKKKIIVSSIHVRRYSSQSMLFSKYLITLSVIKKTSKGRKIVCRSLSRSRNSIYGSVEPEAKEIFSAPQHSFFIHVLSSVVLSSPSRRVMVHFSASLSCTHHAATYLW
jgi:hypothetical protein